jgi:hypothetical protein
MNTEPPTFPEMRAGWYMKDNEWWLTRDAVKQAFCLSERELTPLLATKIRCRIDVNRYNHRRFILYNLDDIKRVRYQTKVLENE